METDGTHANGIFSYGEGTTVEISDSTITTKGDCSGALMTTGGGTTIADGVSLETFGRSSAPIRSDRGGGTVVVSGSTAISHGIGSPAIYSTADVSVSNSSLEATDSEAVVIEGGNSVSLEDVELVGNDADLNGQALVPTSVLIYQSMSGDASEGDSSFSMRGGSLTSKVGSVLHVTNVSTKIELEDVDVESESDDFLILSADSWGKDGSNGGHAEVVLKSQKVKGNVSVDELSSVDLTLSDGSRFEGAVVGDGTKNVVVEDGSVWILTGDSEIDSLDASAGSVETNGFSLVVGGETYDG